MQLLFPPTEGLSHMLVVDAAKIANFGVLKLLVGSDSRNKSPIFAQAKWKFHIDVRRVRVNHSSVLQAILRSVWRVCSDGAGALTHLLLGHLIG